MMQLRAGLENLVPDVVNLFLYCSIYSFFILCIVLYICIFYVFYDINIYFLCLLNMYLTIWDKSIWNVSLLPTCRPLPIPPHVSEDAQYSETGFISSWFFFFRFLVFEIRSILYSTFVVNWSGTWINSGKIYVLRGSAPLNPPVHGELSPHAPHRGLHPWAPDAFGLNPPAPRLYVIMYHWLSFLNQVHKNRSPEFTTNVKYKIDENGS